jgi:hypothetical protein
MLLLAMVGMWQAAPTAFADAEEGPVPPGGTIPAPNPPGGLQGSVNVVHWASFDPDRNLTAIDVRTEAGDLVNDKFAGLKYQDSSQFVVLPAGEYDWKATLVSDPLQTVVDIPPFTLNSGAVLSIMLVTDEQDQVTSLLFVHVFGSVVRDVYWPLITYQ